ncbi:MAG: NAD(P)-binding protein [Acidimicrobiaceae bacterium]|nr:NAD(P)-binding protein [Acidimicrobiaceae bacterium]
MRIAIVGTGVSGLACAHILSSAHEVTLYEADSRPGGHSNTVSLEVEGSRFDVDTGFLVYAPSTYPGFVRFLDELAVETEVSDMSFSVCDDLRGVEWRGSSLATVFAQRRNMWRPSFLRMLIDVVRFNRRAMRLLGVESDPDYTLAKLLEESRWSQGFLDWYLLPLGASIWSSTPEAFRAMPASMLARFFDRHGLLRLSNHPQWRTVSGGSRRYVDAVLAPFIDQGRLHLNSAVTGVRRHPAGVDIQANGTWETFDHAVMALHADQALTLLNDPTSDERAVLGSFRFSENQVTIHHDERLMPSHPRAWASWNYQRTADRSPGVTMTYYLSLLQNLNSPVPILETLNRDEAIEPAKVLHRLNFRHPILDSCAVAAQSLHHLISGPPLQVSYCGAYWANGFHEDGFQSGLRVARDLGVQW